MMVGMVVHQIKHGEAAAAGEQVVPMVQVGTEEAQPHKVVVEVVEVVVAQPAPVSQEQLVVLAETIISAMVEAQLLPLVFMVLAEEEVTALLQMAARAGQG